MDTSLRRCTLLLASLTLATPLVAAAAPQNGGGMVFDDPRIFSFGGDYAVVAVDLDRDGDPDLATTGPTEYDTFGRITRQGDVTLLRNGGPRRYPQSSILDDLDGAHALAAGDLDGDGLVDLVTSDEVQVYLDLGPGRFTPPTSYGIGGREMALADLDNDGDLDLAFPNGSPPFLNDGHGVFAQRFVGGDVQSGAYLAVGDVDHDGVLDFVTSQDTYAPARHHVTLQLGTGDGFGNPGPPQSVDMAGDSTQDVALADLDLDGNLDLLCINDASNDLSVALGRGDGTFEPATTHAVHPSANVEPLSFVVADFDLDGLPDVAVTSTVFLSGSSHVETAILLADGQGDLVVDQVLVRFGTREQDPVAVDIDQDGDVDLLTATHVLLNHLF